MKIDKNRVNADQQDNYSFTETFSQMSSIHSIILLEWALWIDSVSLPMNTTASIINLNR